MEKSSDGIYSKMIAAIDLQWEFYAKKFKLTEMNQHHREAAETMFYAGVIASCEYIIQDDAASVASKEQAKRCMQHCVVRIYVDD